MKKLLLLLFVTLTGCSSDWTIDLSNVNSVNNPIIQPTLQYPNWTPVATGIDFKQVVSTEELFDIVRIDPTQVEISVAVSETNPQTVSDWQSQLGAAVVINGSYFDENYQLVTRTMTAGQSTGPLLSGVTGVFTQLNDQWLISSDAGQLSTSGIQSYPMLVANGIAVTTSTSTDTAQRTIVAVDAAGLVYFIVCEYGVLSLSEVATALTALEDPQIVSALNFDGGTSTGLSVESTTVRYLDDSLVVPSVVALR